MARSIRMSGARAVLSRPVTNSALPAPTGTLTVGSTLTAPTGTWDGTPSPHLVSRQWVRGATDIPGATGATYTLVAADATNAIRVRVFMSNGITDLIVTSAATAAVV